MGRRFIEISAASRSEYYEAVATVSLFLTPVYFRHFWPSVTHNSFFLNQQIHEQERGAAIAANLTGDDVLRRGSSREDQPSGDTTAAAVAAALWNQGPHAQATLPSLPPPPTSTGGFADPMGLHAPGVALGARPPAGRDPTRPLMHQPMPKRTGGGIQIGEHTGFLRMRGLPFSASKDEIFQFFTGYNPVRETIVLTYRNDGRATGEAYVGFATPGDAERAMALHRRSMGPRYIELFISNKEEHSRALARFGTR